MLYCGGTIMYWRTENVANEPVDLAKEISRKNTESAHWLLQAAHDQIFY